MTNVVSIRSFMFQHTAARRRLPIIFAIRSLIVAVSTHSRAEAAAFSRFRQAFKTTVSTHSRAEAAAKVLNWKKLIDMFQHTAARRRLLLFNGN